MSIFFTKILVIFEKVYTFALANERISGLTTYCSMV